MRASDLALDRGFLQGATLLDEDEGYARSYTGADTALSFGDGNVRAVQQLLQALFPLEAAAA